MNIWLIVAQSHVLPIQKFMAFIRVFWLPALSLALICLGNEWLMRTMFNTPTPALTEPGAVFSEGISWGPTYFFLSLLIYSIIMASALVRWHRFLIKDHQPLGARLWLTRGGEWWFLWRWTWIGFVALLISIFVFALMMIVGFIYAELQGSDPEAIADNLSPIYTGSLLGWVFVLAAGLTGRLLPRTTLSLAAIAVGDGAEFWRSRKQSVSSADCSALAVGIVATTAPYCLIAMLPVMLMPADPDIINAPLTPLYVLVYVVSNIFYFYGAVVFATMLSLFYRRRVLGLEQVT